MATYDPFFETVAILVDGEFYLNRAHALFGEKTPEDRADELVEYCSRHLSQRNGKKQHDHLYRIFYYDCEPIATNVYHPLTHQNINMGKTERYSWSMKFFDELANKRKLAIRLGELQERESAYTIKPKALKKLCRGELSIKDLHEDDFKLNLVQKGVDMRIGLDIASLAYKRQVTKIVLISGDSDFVPAAKHARREGIDFVLDPMWQKIRPELNKHIDGLHSCTKQYPTPGNEPLCRKTS